MSHEDHDAVSTVRSLAYMLGWENVPSREVLERSLNALRSKLTNDFEFQKLRADAAEEEAETWRNRAAFAEPRLHESQDRCNRMEMERNQARDERDEIRAELKSWMATHPPGICSAHQKLDLNCQLCNRALYQREVLARAMQMRLDGCTCSNGAQRCNGCRKEHAALDEVFP